MLESIVSVVWPVFALAAVCLGAVSLLVAHEAGHYLACRLAVGIPANAVTIEFSHSGVHHVSLRDDEGWIDPLAYPERHDHAYREFDPQFDHTATVLAAGPLAHALALGPIAFIVSEVAGSALAWGLVFASLGFVGYYLYQEVVHWKRGDPVGDFSSLWMESRALCVALLFVLIGAHLAVLALVLAAG